MRSIYLEGEEDNIRIHLGSDASLVAEIQSIGHARDWLVSEAEMTGEEVLNFFAERPIGPFGRTLDLTDDVVKDHHYILTAFDD